MRLKFDVFAKICCTIFYLFFSDGFPRETPDKVLNCFDTAVQILSIPESTKKLLKPFTVVGCDLFNAGKKFIIIIPLLQM